MPERFLSYLQQERRRLDQELERTMVRGMNRHEILRIGQLLQIVDDQLARWSDDLTTDPLAA